MKKIAILTGKSEGKRGPDLNHRISIGLLVALVPLMAFVALRAQAGAHPSSYRSDFDRNSTVRFDSGSHLPSPAIARATSGPENHSQALAPSAYLKLPLSFVPNAGQVDARVRYAAQSAGKSFYFTSSEAVFNFAAKTKGMVLRLGFLGANPQTEIVGQREEGGKVNYIVGKDPSKWHTNLPTYGEIVYRNLWPGIDLRFRSENGQLLYEFLLKPGARVQDIQLAYRGAKNLSVERDGNLIIHTALGNVTDTRPLTYQLTDGKRVAVKSSFALAGRAGSKTAYGFQVGRYDHRRELVLDPGLVYSTYLGGTADDSGHAIAVDSAGQAYVTGNTYSLNFPTTAGAYDRTYNGGVYPFGGGDVFITKLNSSGSALVYSTYLGGTLDEPIFGASIAIDGTGHAYVTGSTASPDFPTTPGAFQPTLKGVENAFVTKLSQSGSSLVYSTYLGGTGQDGPYFYSDIAVDPSGYAYVTGYTSSIDFPTTPGAFQTTFQGPPYDAYATKLNRSGTGLVYSTYLGGASDDEALGIAIDGDGHAYVTGLTSSPNFPTKNAAQPVIGGSYDAFVTKLNSSGTALIYSTFLGGTLNDAAGSVAVEQSGSAYVTGSTLSPNFPTKNAFQPAPGGGYDVFVTKLSPSGSSFAYSTYLGGAADEQGNSIKVDSAGQAHVAGFTSSPNFPVTPDAFQPANNGADDAFVTKLDPSGSALVYSTYLGGTAEDFGNGIALDRSSKVYVTGSTDSVNFPTTPGAFDTTYNGGTHDGDAFVTKLDVPRGEADCDRADGDGEAEEHDSGRKSHFHFHKKSSCPDANDTENDNVEADDDGSGPHFQSTSVTSATYTVADTSQAVTIVGTGTHNGLPVNFTMMSVSYGSAAPAIFQIILTDGYKFTGSVISGAISIQ